MRKVYTPPRGGSSWHWAILGALGITLTVFLILPLSQMISSRIADPGKFAKVDTYDEPPPPDIMEEKEPDPPEKEEEQEEPELDEAPQNLDLNFDLALPVYLEAIEKEPGKNLKRILGAADLLTKQAAWVEAGKVLSHIHKFSGEEMDQEETLSLLKLEARVAWAGEAGADAIKNLEKVVATDPLDGEALLMLGDYYGKSGEKEKAAYRFELASNIVGVAPDALLKHAQLLVGQQKYKEAIGLLQKAEKLKPRDYVRRYLEKVEQVARAAKS